MNREVQTRIRNWLKEQKVSADAYDAEVLVKCFLKHMEKGLTGRTSSLDMLPAYISFKGAVPANKKVAVIDAGGTNLRVYIAHFDDKGKIHFTYPTEPTKPTEIPGHTGEIPAEDFYNALVEKLVPVRNEFDAIGFCFSYPTEILPDHDGKLLRLAKELKVTGLVDTCIGKGLQAALEEKNITGKRVVILNDTVATLLAGIAETQDENPSSFVGFILGTGTNTAYVEHNIGKLQSVNDAGPQVINVESGGFDGFERGTIDKKLDSESDNPGKHKFEKVISGAYLGLLTLLLMQEMVAQGFFSETGSTTLKAIKELPTPHISNLCANNGDEVGILGSESFTDDDRSVMKEVFGAVVDRAALLTAVNLTAAIMKSVFGLQEGSHQGPVTITIDGTTYYKTFQMSTKVQSYLQDLLPGELHDRCTCIEVKDAPAVGAAIAALTTFHQKHVCGVEPTSTYKQADRSSL